MDMSGVDRYFPIAYGVDATDIVLRACQRHWPECVLRNATDDEDRSLDDPDLWIGNSLGKEFFVYRCRRVAECWHKQGAAEDNRDSMLHVMIAAGENDRNRICVVEIHDEANNMIQKILAAMEQGLNDAGTVPEIYLLAGEAA